jgi:hypothetical protein
MSDFSTYWVNIPCRNANTFFRKYAVNNNRQTFTSALYLLPPENIQLSTHILKLSKKFFAGRIDISVVVPVNRVFNNGIERYTEAALQAE